jgi:hypothetical protein
MSLLFSFNTARLYSCDDPSHWVPFLLWLGLSCCRMSQFFFQSQFLRKNVQGQSWRWVGKILSLKDNFFCPVCMHFFSIILPDHTLWWSHNVAPPICTALRLPHLWNKPVSLSHTHTEQMCTTGDKNIHMGQTLSCPGFKD